jgi:ankyrin repeat protein
MDLLSIKDKHLNTLMHIAAGFGRLKSVQALMKLCPKMIEQLDDKNHTPIDVAIKHGQLEVTKWLLSKTDRLITDSHLNTIELNRTYDSNSTRSCLHLAAKHGENEILRFILNEMHKKQFTMDIQDLNGNTACHLAAKYGHLDCLQVFIFLIY